MKTYKYDSWGQTIMFAESLGWVEPPLETYYKFDDADRSDALEEHALNFIESQGYEIDVTEEKNKDDETSL
jgi:hypothetical protein